jgi:hypothetical protein
MSYTLDSLWVYQGAWECVTSDGSTHRNQSFFDLHQRVYYHNNLMNLHLVAMSMFEWHMVLNVFNMISKFGRDVQQVVREADRHVDQ